MKNIRFDLKWKVVSVIFAFALVLCVLWGGVASLSASAEEHIHTFSDQWTAGYTNHWHASDCGHNIIADAAAHTYSNGVCTVCGEPQQVSGHVHTYNTTVYKYDKLNHWYASTCGHYVVKNISKHILVNGVCLCGYSDGTQGGGQGNQGGGQGGGQGNTELPEDKDPVELPAEVSAAGGYNESLFAEWKAANVVGVTASYQLEGSNSWTPIDEQLIRMVNGTARLDAVGLTAGTYNLKISNEGSADITVNGIKVSAYDRSGYAHFDRKSDEAAYGGVGAYNDDGTLKDGALVIYVTNANKNNVSNFVYKNTANGLVKEDISQYIKPGKPTANGKDLGGETYASIGYILNNRGYTNNNERETYGIQKLSFTYPGVAVRILDTVTSELNSDKCSPTLTGLTYYAKAGETNPITGETYKKGLAVPNGGTVNDNGQLARITNAKNLTIEGVGEDAVMYGWGIHFVSNDNLHKNKGAGSSFEVRNITFQNYPEDAIGMEGTQGDKVDATGSITSGASSASADLVSPVERCWIHNNTFLPGYCASPAESDKAEGDGSCDFKRGQYYTLSYNYFEYCHKTNLIGSSDTSLTYNVTMHHNWWNNCGSRQPLARRANIHFYNNYISGDPSDSKASLSYVTSLRANCLVFSEANFYDGCKNVTQKKDGAGAAWNNIYYSCSDENQFTELTSRTQTVSNSCAFIKRNIDYSQFYVNPLQFYYDSENKISDCLLDTPAVARVRVMMFAGVNGFGKTREETKFNQNEPSSAVSVGESGLTVDLSKVGKGSSTVSNVVFSNISGVSGGTVKGKGQMITFKLTSEAQLTVTTSTSGDFAPSLIGADGTVYASKFTGTLTIVLQEGTYIVATGIKDKESTITALSFADTSSSSAARVEAAENAIRALPDSITVADAEAVTSASQAYEALTSSEKASFDAELKTKLDRSLSLLASAQISDVIAKIDAIGTVTEDSFDAINAADKAYNALNSSQQALVTNVNVLVAAKQAYESFAVSNFEKTVAALVDVANINISDEEAVENAVAAYNAAYEIYGDFSEEQLEQVTEASKTKLLSGRESLAQLVKLFEFKAKLAGVALNDVTISDGAALSSAYNALTQAQKDALTGDEVTKYNDYIEAYEKLAKQAKTVTFIGGKPSDAIFEVTSGNPKSNAFKVHAYSETETLASGLKLESSTQITLTLATKMRLTLYFDGTGATLIDGTSKSVTSTAAGDNVIIIDLDAGTHTIAKDKSNNLYYATLVPVT